MPHLKLKRYLGKVWPAKNAARKIILLYHSIGNHAWALTPKKFYDQINWLCDHHHVLPLTEILKSKPSKEIQIALTFDDGYSTLFDQVAPKLLERKINATVYMNTGWITNHQDERKKSDASLGHYPDEFFLTWHEVKQLYNAGWEIGSHGVNHYNFAQLNHELMQQELTYSKKHIEEHLKTTCIHFAYPWGRYSLDVKRSAFKIGYRYAAAAFHAPLNTHTDCFALPRINIAQEYSFSDFKNIVLGKWDYLRIIHRLRGL